MTQPLNRAAIVAAARRIADRDGLAELTLRRIAGELGTGAASLYRHIADRQELLLLLVEDLVAGYPLLDPAGVAPVEAVVRQWHAMYDHLVAHAWSGPVIADGDYALPSAKPVADHCMALLRGAGLDDVAAQRVYRAAWRLIIGHLMSRHPFGHLQGAPPQQDDFDWALRTLLRGALAE
ncbi:TetR family transcriptional regulator [Mycobacterium sp. UM_WWY]